MKIWPNDVPGPRYAYATIKGLINNLEKNN